MKHTKKENEVRSDSEHKTAKRRRANRRLQNRLWIMFGVFISILLLAYWLFFATLQDS